MTASRDLSVRPKPPPPTPLRDTPAGKAAAWGARTWWRNRLILLPVNIGLAGLATAGLVHANPQTAIWVEAGAPVATVGAALGHAEWRRRNDRTLNLQQAAYNTCSALFLAGTEIHAVTGDPFTPTSWRVYVFATATAQGLWLARALARSDTPDTPEPTAETPAKRPDRAQLWAARIGCTGGPIANSTLTGVKELIGADGKPNGQTGTITLNADGGAIRHTSGDVAPQLEKIATGLDVKPANIAVEPLTSSKLTLLMFNRNPLSDPVLWTGPGDHGTFRHPAGMTPTGKWVHQQLVVPGWGAVHELIVGSTGSGKSRTARLRLAMARHSLNKNGQPSVASWLLDPHQGSSYSGWRDNVDVIAKGDWQILAALAAAIIEKNERLAILAASGREVLRPSPELPHIRIILDEFPGFIQRCPQAAPVVAELVAEGRKVLIGLTVLTQYPAAEKLGNDMSIRDGLMTTATVHRTGNSFSGMIVANGKQIGDPAALPRMWADGTSAAGVAYHLGAEADHSVMIRAAVAGLDVPWDDDEHDAPPFDRDWFTSGATVRTNAGHALTLYLAAHPDGPPEDSDSSAEQRMATVLARATAPAGATLWERIHLFLSELGEEASTGTICAGVGVPEEKKNSVSQACARAAADGNLVKTGHGTWALPQHARLVGAGAPR